MWKKMAGPVMDAACATYEGISFELDLFPRTREPVWILGKEYITDRGNNVSFYFWSREIFGQF